MLKLLGAVSSRSIRREKSGNGRGFKKRLLKVLKIAALSHPMCLADPSGFRRRNCAGTRTPKGWHPHRRKARLGCERARIAHVSLEVEIDEIVREAAGKEEQIRKDVVPLQNAPGVENSM
jgi:hypothetical protein